MKVTEINEVFEVKGKFNLIRILVQFETSMFIHRCFFYLYVLRVQPHNAVKYILKME